MKQLPATENPLVLRTDFSDQTAWESICSTIRAPVTVGGFDFRADIEFIDDVEYEGVTKDQLMKLVTDNYEHSFIVIADRTTISRPDYPLLIVDLSDEPGREFRAIPSRIQSIENNLSTANMDFEEFAEDVDESGVFRGFPEN